MRKTDHKRLRLAPESIRALAIAELKIAGGGSEACTTEGQKSLCVQGCESTGC